MLLLAWLPGRECASAPTSHVEISLPCLLVGYGQDGAGRVKLKKVEGKALEASVNPL